MSNHDPVPRSPFTRALIAALFCAATVSVMNGCADRNERARVRRGPLPSEKDVNEQLVNLPFNQQTAAGAVAGRTIYPHHFVMHGVSLNALGELQIEMLLDAATDQPMKINIMDTDAPKELHEGRVATVRERLLAEGVEEGRLQIVNALPEGRGVWTEIIVQAMQREQQQSRGNRSRSTGSGTGVQIGGGGGTGSTAGGGAR